MSRTKHYQGRWPNGGRPGHYRYHKDNSRKIMIRDLHKKVRLRNKFADQLTFMSISQTYGTYKMRDLSCKQDYFLAGKWTVAQLTQQYDKNQHFSLSPRTYGNLIKVAKLQIKRRGKIGAFRGHKDKRTLYKNEINCQFIPFG